MMYGCYAPWPPTLDSSTQTSLTQVISPTVAGFLRLNTWIDIGYGDQILVCAWWVRGWCMVGVVRIEKW